MRKTFDTIDHLALMEVLGPRDLQELYLILTNGNFKDNRLFLGKKSKRNENLSEKDLEKTFYTRKGICQHLSKVINKLVYII